MSEHEMADLAMHSAENEVAAMMGFKPQDVSGRLTVFEVRRLWAYACSLTLQLQQRTQQRDAACSSTYGDLVKRAPYLAQQIQSHEWDNKTPSEQRDWLLSALDNKTLPPQPTTGELK